MSASTGQWLLPCLQRGVGRPEGTKARLRPSINPTQVLMSQEVGPITIFVKVFRKKFSPAVFANPPGIELQHRHGTVWPTTRHSAGNPSRISYTADVTFNNKLSSKSSNNTNCPGMAPYGPTGVNDAAIPSPSEDSAPMLMATVAVCDKPL